jgi:hypothetical protein
LPLRAFDERHHLTRDCSSSGLAYSTGKMPW